VEEVSARPEAVKQVAEIDKGYGSAVYGGGRAERAASGGRYRMTAYRDGGRLCRGGRFCGYRRDFLTLVSYIEERLRRRKAGHAARLDPPRLAT